MDDPVDRIRLATVEDLASLLPLVREFHALEQLRISEEERAAVVQRLLGEPGWGRIWMIFEAGKLTGYIAICIGFSIEFLGNDAFIDEFFIRPEARGRGLGTAVLNQVQVAAKALGIHALHLEVARSNARARKLYGKAQFEAREDYMLMTRLLQDRAAP